MWLVLTLTFLMTNSITTVVEATKYGLMTANVKAN